MQAAQQLDPGVRAQRLEEAAVHAGKINRPRARHTAHRIRTGRVTPPSYRQTDSSHYTVNGRGGEQVRRKLVLVKLADAKAETARDGFAADLLAVPAPLRLTLTHD